MIPQGRQGPAIRLILRGENSAEGLIGPHMPPAPQAIGTQRIGQVMRRPDGPCKRISIQQGHIRALSQLRRCPMGCVPDGYNPIPPRVPRSSVAVSRHSHLFRIGDLACKGCKFWPKPGCLVPPSRDARRPPCIMGICGQGPEDRCLWPIGRAPAPKRQNTQHPVGPPIDLSQLVYRQRRIRPIHRAPNGPEGQGAGL